MIGFVDSIQFNAIEETLLVERMHEKKNLWKHDCGFYQARRTEELFAFVLKKLFHSWLWWSSYRGGLLRVENDTNVDNIDRGTSKLARPIPIRGQAIVFLFKRISKKEREII